MDHLLISEKKESQHEDRPACGSVDKVLNILPYDNFISSPDQCPECAKSMPFLDLDNYSGIISEKANHGRRPEIMQYEIKVSGNGLLYYRCRTEDDWQYINHEALVPLYIQQREILNILLRAEVTK